MKSITLNLNNINDAKELNRKMSKYVCNVSLRSDKYIVDAKSLLGIFSLDLSQPVTLFIEDDAEEYWADIEKDVEALSVK